VSPTLAADPPPYVRTDAFTERDVIVGKDPWALPGTLSLPKGDGPFPAVVLVHGSGPQDRDESLPGAFGLTVSHPFRDIAHGLASRGVAVLRYDKRTKAHGGRMGPHFKEHPKDLNIDFEAVDDAVIALELARSTAGIDPKRVFLLGHSLGGALAPRIAERDGKVAGLIILAGMARTVEDTLPDQLEYLRALPGGDTNVPEPLLKGVKEACELLRSGKWPDGAKLFGLPIDYWAGLNAALPERHPAGLKRPMLILQGERDYQVTMKDFELWKKLTAGRADVSAETFPKLNHLFIEGEGKSGPAEYAKGGSVSGAVIEKIGGWVAATGK
jgi:dienelactone hydrolase